MNQNQVNNAAATITLVLFIGTAVIGWSIPVVVALARKMPNAGAVIVIDLLLGWTVVGWIVALAMACGSKPQRWPQPPPPRWQPPPVPPGR